MTLLASREAVEEWLLSLPDVSRGTLAQLDLFANLLTQANASQNLVAASTLGETLWTRHIADSAQLLPLATGQQKGGRWVDLGSGPGLPGLIIALLAPDYHVTLVESRRLRCGFLRDAVEQLGLAARVTIVEGRVEQMSGHGHAFDVISARAFAPLPRLVSFSQHLANKSTIWLLPKGRNAVNELSTLPVPWQKLFHVEPSLTDSDAFILVGRGVAGSIG